jgi:hypothetical protein
VLGGKSRPQVFKVMRSWSAALGVRCGYCHTRRWADDTPRMDIARLMQRDYVTGLKQKTGKSVGCRDCHQGQPDFLRTRPFHDVLGANLPGVRVLADTDNIREVMVRFTEALGVKCSHCHTLNFHDATPMMPVTRFMMTEFTRRFVTRDGSSLSCSNCHQGRDRFLSRTVGKT